MAENPEPTGIDQPGDNFTSRDDGAPCYDAIALKAYFIALNRHARGEPPDPLQDWLEAERQLHVGDRQAQPCRSGNRE